MNSDVLVKFRGDTQDLDKKTKSASSSLKGFASGVASLFKTAGAVIGATTVAVGGLVKKSVEAYAEFEQLEGGLVSLFGEGSNELKKIMEDSENAYATLTMSQNQYLTAFESAYPIVNAGLSDNADAIEYTNKMLQLSSDLFNTYGGSTEYYQNAINWALKGSFVYLDNLNLGIKGTQEGFIEAANNSGILGRNIQSVSELTNDEIIDVIQHYAEAYGVWGKTGDEASKTILGSLNMVKATWSNFVSGLSKNDADIDKLIQNLMKAVTTFGENVLPVVVKALSGIADALPKIAELIGQELPTLVDKVIPPLLKAVIQVAQALVDVLPSLVETLLPPLIQGVIQIVKGIVEALPSLLTTLAQGVIDLVKGLAEVLPDLIDAILKGAIEIIKALAEALPDLLPTIVEAIVGIIPVILENLPLFIKVGIQLIIGLLKGLILAIPEIIKQIPDMVIAIIDGFKDAFGCHSPSTIFADIGINLIKGLWNGISNVTSWIIGKIKGFGNSVIKSIKGIFGIHSPSTEFEWIGKMNMVGFEQGMEGMKNQVQSTIDSVFDLQPSVNGQMNSTYSPQMNVIVQNNMEFDPLGQVVNKIKTFSGGAKNDYNWGATI